MKANVIAVLAVGGLVLAGVFGANLVTGEDRVQEIRMWVEQIEWEVHPGKTTTVWAFCAEGDAVEPVNQETCGVPGPTVRVQAGDKIKLTFENTHNLPHTVHFHGWHPMEADMNGNALTGDAMVVQPGETQVIEWVAEPAGTFIYHCHFETNVHMEMGMYGTFIVEDPRQEPADVDHIMMLDEWSLNGLGFQGAMPVYDHFTINGKSFPLTQPILADEGDLVRLHMVNAGYKFHAMHLHGYTPDSWEGIAGPEHAVPTDVRTVAPGQAVVLELTADRPGVWLMHDHVVPHVTAGADGTGWGAYPRGMLTVLAVGPEAQAALQQAVPQLLAAAQGDAAGNGHGDHDHVGAGAAHEDEADPAAEDDGVVVEMENFAYAQPTVTIPAGTTVTWTNQDGVYHTVTSTEDRFDSGKVQPGQAWSHTFEDPGEYAYYCIPHAYQDDAGTWQGMVGKIVVEAA